MWAHVEYLCDHKKCDVPLDFFKNHEEIKSEWENGQIRKKYYVFWSDKKGDNPKKLELREGRILIVDNVLKKNKTKTNEAVGGYYAAILFYKAPTLDELKKLEKLPESRRPMTPNIDTCYEEDKPKLTKTLRNRAGRQQREQARKHNQCITNDTADNVKDNDGNPCTNNDAADNVRNDDTNAFQGGSGVNKPLISNNSKSDESTVSKPTRKNASLAKKKIKDAAHAASDDSDYSPEEDDDVVPASLLAKAQKELQEMKEDLRRQKNFVTNLTAELQAATAEKERVALELRYARESIDNSKRDVEDLKNQIKSLSELNRMWQEKELSRSSKRSHSSSRESHSTHRSGHDRDRPKKQKLSYDNNEQSSKAEVPVEEPLKSPDFLDMSQDGEDILTSDLASETESNVEKKSVPVVKPKESVVVGSSDVGEQKALKSDRDSDHNAAAVLRKPGAETPVTRPPEPVVEANARSTTNDTPVQTPKLKGRVKKEAVLRGGIRLGENEYTIKAPANAIEVPYDAFMRIAKAVKVGKQGDSQFIKNLCDIQWTKPQMMDRCSAGKLCTNKEGPQKKECTPEKKKYLQDLLQLRIKSEISQDDPESQEKRGSMSNVKTIIRSKLMTVSRPTEQNNAGNENH